MNELFAPESVAKDSPRLAWMKSHHVNTKNLPDILPDEDEDEFGSILWPWLAWTGSGGYLDQRRENQAQGNTEDDAITALAVKRGWKLWNEVL